MKRSRSLETDLDTVSAQERYEPTIGARNLQMDDVIVHGRWDLRESSENVGTYHSSQRSTESSNSSTQSPKAKRRRMTAEKIC